MVCDMKFSLEYNYYTNPFNETKNLKGEPVYPYELYIFLKEEVVLLSNYYKENHTKIKKVY
jgi:hypothetical protein